MLIIIFAFINIRGVNEATFFYFLYIVTNDAQYIDMIESIFKRKNVVVYRKKNIYIYIVIIKCKMRKCAQIK